MARDARGRGRAPAGRTTSCCRRPRRSPAFAAELPSPTNDPKRPLEHIGFTLPYNMSEQPAASINCGYTAGGPADRPADRRPSPRRPRRAAGGARLGADAAGAAALAGAAGGLRRASAMRDPRGNPVSTRSAAAIEAAERALWRLMSFYGTPLDDLDAAIAADPAWLLPHADEGRLPARPERAGFAARGCRAARAGRAAAGRRERARARAPPALRTLQSGDWHGACGEWEALLLDHPRDALALQWAHLFDFYRGDALNLRQRVAARAARVGRRRPAPPHVLALLAFGLEESNLYAAGRGRRPARARRRPEGAVGDARGRARDGDAGPARGGLALDAALARRNGRTATASPVHLGWHQALFALERLDTATALRAARRAPGGGPDRGHARSGSTPRRCCGGCTCSAPTSAPLARRCSRSGTRRRRAAGHYAFNDAARADGAGRRRRRRARRGAGCALSQRGAERPARATNREMARDVGLPLMRGAAGLRARRDDDAVAALAPLRRRPHRFGGSHAQRDVIDQTLLAACGARRRPRVGRALLNERLPMKPETPLTALWRSRLGVRTGATPT